MRAKEDINKKTNMSIPIPPEVLSARFGADGVLTLYLPERMYQTVEAVKIKNASNTKQNQKFYKRISTD